MCRGTHTLHQINKTAKGLVYECTEASTPCEGNLGRQMTVYTQSFAYQGCPGNGIEAWRCEWNRCDQKKLIPSHHTQRWWCYIKSVMGGARWEVWRCMSRRYGDGSG